MKHHIFLKNQISQIHKKFKLTYNFRFGKIIKSWQLFLSVTPSVVAVKHNKTLTRSRSKLYCRKSITKVFLLFSFFFAFPPICFIVLSFFSFFFSFLNETVVHYIFKL